MLPIVPKTEQRFWGIFRCLVFPCSVVGFVMCGTMAITTALGANAPVIKGREVRGFQGVLSSLALFPMVTLFFTTAFSIALYWDRFKARRQK